MSKRVPPCGNEDCGVSTGICDNITAGTGVLSVYGYWEYPCSVCPPIFEKLLKEETAIDNKLIEAKTLLF